MYSTVENSCIFLLFSSLNGTVPVPTFTYLYCITTQPITILQPMFFFGQYRYWPELIKYFFYI